MRDSDVKFFFHVWTPYCKGHNLGTIGNFYTRVEVCERQYSRLQIILRKPINFPAIFTLSRPRPCLSMITNAFRLGLVLARTSETHTQTHTNTHTYPRTPAHIYPRIPAHTHTHTHSEAQFFTVYGGYFCTVSALPYIRTSKTSPLSPHGAQYVTSSSGSCLNFLPRHHRSHIPCTRFCLSESSCCGPDGGGCGPPSCPGSPVSSCHFYVPILKNIIR